MQGKLFSLVLMYALFSGIRAFSQPMAQMEAYSYETSPTDVEHSVSHDIRLEYYFEILDSKTPIDLKLNSDVLYYIDLFLGKRRPDLEIALERSQLYFPIFEEMLDRYNLPLELKYLSVIESGLNPLAKSPSGAVGLWQFLYNTCSLFDLKVDSYIDERCDPYKATEAACKYMSYLYRTYQDWNLVMASYNGGPGEVRKAIARSNGATDYWEIRPQLSRQAQNYVPAFIAVAYLMNHYERYGLKARRPRFSYAETDTIMVQYGVSFNQITSIVNISEQELAFLNPSYRKHIIPDLEQPCILILPSKLIDVYLQKEREIVNCYLPKPNYNMLKTMAGSVENRSKVVHVVRKGEFCHKIALNYNCTIENLKAWNNLTSTTIHPGQTLDIWVSNYPE